MREDGSRDRYGMEFSCFPAFELNSLKYNKFFVSFFFPHILNADCKFVPSVPKRYVHHYETGKIMAGRYTKKRRMPI